MIGKKSKFSRLMLFISYFVFVFLVSLDAYATDSKLSMDVGQNTLGPFDFLLQTVSYFLLAFFVYWMLVLRPNQLEQQKREAFLEKLKKGDDVVTKGGIIAKVFSVKKEHVMLELSSNVKIKVMADCIEPISKEEGEKNKGFSSNNNKKK